MDLDLFNGDTTLSDTPLGRLTLVRYGYGTKAWVGVVATRPDVPFDPDGPGEIIHTLEEGSDIFASIYGKRFWERAHVAEGIRRQAVRQEDLSGREEQDLSRAFVADLRTVLSRVR